MKNRSKNLFEGIIQIASQTLILGLALISIAFVRYIIERSWGKDFSFFDVFSLNKIIFLANSLVVGMYLWRIISLIFISPRQDSNDIVDIVTTEEDSDKEPKDKSSQLRRLTVVELLAAYKSRRILIATSVLVISSLVYVSLSRRFGYELNVSVLAIVWLLLFALFINLKALTYRIRKGIYGTNEYEAREMITYILSRADKGEFSDGDGPREICLPLEQDVRPEPELRDGLEGVEA